MSGDHVLAKYERAYKVLNPTLFSESSRFTLTGNSPHDTVRKLGHTSEQLVISINFTSRALLS